MDAKAGFFLKTKVKQNPVVPQGIAGFYFYSHLIE